MARPVLLVSVSLLTVFLRRPVCLPPPPKAREARYPHAERTLTLTEQALGMFETYPGTVAEGDPPRISRQAVNVKAEASVQLALLGRYEKAAELIGQAIDVYRKEGWMLLLTRALEQSCRYSYQLGDADLYIRNSMELCSPKLPRSDEERTLAQSNMMAYVVAKGQGPFCSPLVFAPLTPSSPPLTISV